MNNLVSWSLQMDTLKFKRRPELNFPAVCMDGFYKDPDAVRKFALEQDFCVRADNFPGARTKPINLINSVLFDSFCHKLFSLLYNLDTVSLRWHVKTSFHLLPPLDPDPNSNRNKGLVHFDYDNDYHFLAGVVYITPGIEVNTGTSLFRERHPDNEFLSSYYERTGRAMKNFYASGVDVKDEYGFDYNDYRSNHEEIFEETARFNNVYNRLVAYPANTLHAFNSCYTKGEPRLTQVFFVDELSNLDISPVQRSMLSQY